LFLLVAVFAGWFAYDGWVGYPRENWKGHLEQLPPEEREGAKDVRINELVIEESIPRLREALKQHTLAAQRAALEELYGEPPAHENSESWFYFGPAFGITIPLENGKPTADLIPRRTEKSTADILFQRALAVGLGLFSLGLLRLLVRTFRTRLVLDDEGLAYQGKGPIAWEAMKSLDISHFAKKGWVDLIYNDHGTERKLRLDEYHLAKFDETIDELCARRAFEHPSPPKEDEPAPQT
jgi:hypothetical protein